MAEHTPSRMDVMRKAFVGAANELEHLDTAERVRVLTAVIYLFGLETLLRQHFGK